MDRTLDSRNRKTMLACLTIVVGMIGLSFASVPLYDWFCRVTGIAGTTQTAAESSGVVIDRVMRIRFDVSTNSALPWRIEPVRREISMKIGETAVAFYRATNYGDETITGTATFNVTPLKAGLYFTKIDCFCFTEQRLAPGQTVDMPVTFFVDPEIVNDRNLDDVTTITLSYTFYRVEPDVAEAKTALMASPVLNSIH
jgi:cytochrome c oxidase assembly protein subunit 11